MARAGYLEALRGRVLVYDGAMGTSIQGKELGADDFGGTELEGCNDHLVFSRPDVIEEIHGSFLEAGCDVVETNTFRANRLTLREYGLEGKVLALNRAAAELARRACDRHATEARPRYVAGSMGPSGFLPSSNDPALGDITYGELVDVFAEQATGLVEGGVDVLLIETSQDLLEVKAQVAGIRRALKALGRDGSGGGQRVPIQAQVTLDTSGRMLLGTDISAAATVLEALRVDVMGLNCSTGPEPMRDPVRWLAENTRLPISVIPNAGIPHNEGGEAVYPLTPEALAEAHETFVKELGVGVVGGCCGTTPEHIRQVVDRVGGATPAARSVTPVARVASAMTAYDMAQIPAPTLIGERVNTQGSRKVKRLLLDDDYEGVRDVARGQVEGGAHLLDVCVALTERQDEAEQMRTLVKLLAQSVEAPLVIDTTETDVVRAALEQYPGRAVINSINLENGRDRIDDVVPLAIEHGAALVALTIDRDGMAKTADRKVEIAKRIHGIVVDEYGLHPSDLVFDALTFTLATGDDEFRRSAMATLDGVERIKDQLPGVLTSLGVSNVSFGLQTHGRAVLNSVFLHHCVERGLDMAIVNPAHITPYAEIDEEQRQLADDLIFDGRDDALARFIAFYEEHGVEEEAEIDPRDEMDVDAAIHWSVLHRKKDGVEGLVDAAISRRMAGSSEEASSSTWGSGWGSGWGEPPDASDESATSKGAAGTAGREQPAGADGSAGWGDPGAADAADGEGPGPGVAAEGEPTTPASQPGAGNGAQPDDQKGGPNTSPTPTTKPAADAGGGIPNPVSHAAGVDVLNNVLLPAMKEVGDKFGNGDLILPFVLQSAEVMKKAVARLETYLEKVEGESKGAVVLATVYGDVHDIGKNLVRTILDNNGYTVHDLGKQVPVNDIIAKAQEVDADVIGLSALLVSTSKQMPAAVRELHRRELAFPVMCGGAAITPSFVRASAFVDDEHAELYGPGVWYCKDAFEGLAVVEALVGDDGAGFTARRLAEIRERTERRAELEAKAKAVRPAARPGPSRNVEVPEPSFTGVKVVDRIPLEELYPLMDLNTLYRLHWGAKNAKGEAYERLKREEFEPRLERFQREALAGARTRVRAAYGFWPAHADGNAVVVRDPRDPSVEIERFEFPRQAGRESLCLSDYFRPALDGEARDYVGFLIVSVSDSMLERSESKMREGEYTEGYYLHGFGVRLAEAAAEWVHRRMRDEWGIEEGRGLRYAWGYPACPDHEQHEIVYRLLPAREELGMELTGAGALVPELSTAAIVVHHPDAKYFSAG